MNDVFLWPAGTWATLIKAPPEEIAEFPECGVCSVWICPSGAFPSIEDVLDAPVFEFSAGNHWPDTQEMAQELRHCSAASLMCVLWFQTDQDARDCYARLLKGGVLARPLDA